MRQHISSRSQRKYERPIIYIYYLYSLSGVCKFRGTHWRVKRHRQYKNRHYIVGQWKLHLYWVDPFCPSNILWPHTSVCAYKLHSKVCMDSPCSYSRSLVSKACKCLSQWNSSQRLSFNCQSNCVGDDWDSSTIFPLEYSYIFNGTYISTNPKQREISFKTGLPIRDYFSSERLSFIIVFLTSIIVC